MDESDNEKGVRGGSASERKPVDNSSAVDRSRRSLAKAGLAGPVIMSLASRPVIAVGTGGGGCLSGQMSGNVSQQGHWDNSCTADTGCTPQFWKDNPLIWLSVTGYSAGQCSETLPGDICNKWDPSALAGATLFSDVFLVPPGDLTMMEVLIDSQSSLEAHAVAAVLNVRRYGAAVYGESEARIVEAYYKVSQGEATSDWLLGILSAKNTNNCDEDNCASGKFFNESGQCKNFV